MLFVFKSFMLLVFFFILLYFLYLIFSPCAGNAPAFCNHFSCCLFCASKMKVLYYPDFPDCPRNIHSLTARIPS